MQFTIEHEETLDNRTQIKRLICDNCNDITVKKK